MDTQNLVLVFAVVVVILPHFCTISLTTGDGTVVQNQVSRYGRIEEADPAAAELFCAARNECLPVTRQTIMWAAPGDLSDHFHLDFAIGFQVDMGGDGVRRFTPLSSLDRFIDDAFYAGLRLLERDRGLSSERSATYRGMKFIFDRVRGMKEHHDRKFAYSRDIHIRRTGRLVDEDRNVLPDHLGRDSEGRGKSWTPTILSSEGRARAVEEGLARPDMQHSIAYGLLVAAELNPLTVQDHEVASLVRASLFALPANSSEVSDDLLDEVYARLIDRFNEHHCDDNDEFDRWFRGKNSNLFKSVGGKAFKPEEVRRALLELGWKAYEYVAGCISYFIQSFAKSLPAELSTRERELLAHTYQPQPYLGGLPLIFLMEREQLIKPLIRRLWDSPGDVGTVRVLHRLLDYYGTIAANRRDADVRTKKRQGQLEVAAETVLELNAVASDSSTCHEEVDQILELFIRRQDIRCGECGLLLEGGAGSTAGPPLEGHFPIECWCRAHPSESHTFQVPLDELRRIADDLVLA